MYSTFLQLHSYWAYVTIALLLIAIVNAFMGRASSREFKVLDRKISMYALIASHIQLVFGLVMFLTGQVTKISEFGMGTIMKNSAERLLVIEHPLINIIAIVLITIGWSRHKKRASDSAKFTSIGVFYLIGLILLLSRIPWSNWLNF